MTLFVKLMIYLICGDIVDQDLAIVAIFGWKSDNKSYKLGTSKRKKLPLYSIALTCDVIVTIALDA